jgi:hypothetical protein
VSARRIHPDDERVVACADCQDTGRIVYGRVDAETIDEEDCPCAAGRRRLERRATWKAPTPAHETTFMPGGRLS